jgi:hypothetical protein
MNRRRILNTVSTVLLGIMVVIVIVDCDTEKGIMIGGEWAGMGLWNWPQILISSGVGFLIGFLFNVFVTRRNL